jgi:2-keto-4-pentenoate hydratase/2-oxohepta-3-ene-1,7-dioic acid hydratase in catechol pathway
MKFVTCNAQGEKIVGVLRGETVTPVNELIKKRAKPAVNSMLELIDACAKDASLLSELQNADPAGVKSIPLRDVSLCAPIPFPRRNIFCLGKNYAKHATEVKATRLSGNGIPTIPVYFTKLAAPATAPGGEILVPINATQQPDYEAELALIIGTGGRDIAPEDAEKHIFGYTVLNDVSARDLQKNHEQWFKGKSLDTFCPMGPALVTRDEVPFPVDVAVTCRVNGELRQSGRTSELIFDIPTIISDLSKGITLYPGDIISTGTPAGVGAGHNPPLWLGDGDTVECAVEKIGTLSNTVKYK